MAKKLGRRPIITIEKLSELPLIIEVAQKLGVEPDIGFRMKADNQGRWALGKSGGERAKFGLTIGDVQQAITLLTEMGQLDAVRLIHFHLGSQLTSIHSLKVALKEVGQVYVQLRGSAPI